MSDLAASPSRDLGAWLRGAVHATWIVAGIEWAVACALGARRISGVWELQFGTLWLAPFVLLLGGVVGISGAFFWRAVMSSSSPSRVAVVGVTALCVAALAFGVSGGRHFEAISARLGFVLGLASLGGVGAYFALPWVASLGRQHPRRLALLVCGAIVGLEAANAWVLVRLYPSFHLALALLALGLAPLLVLSWPHPRNASGRLRGAGTGAVSCS
jgi:hypothetical protein